MLGRLTGWEMTRARGVLLWLECVYVCGGGGVGGVISPNSRNSKQDLNEKSEEEHLTLWSKLCKSPEVGIKLTNSRSRKGT